MGSCGPGEVYLTSVIAISRNDRARLLSWSLSSWRETADEIISGGNRRDLVSRDGIFKARFLALCKDQIADQVALATRGLQEHFDKINEQSHVNLRSGFSRNDPEENFTNLGHCMECRGNYKEVLLVLFLFWKLMTFEDHDFALNQQQQQHF